MMLLRPNLLGFDEIHLTFGHQIVDRPQILDVFVRYEFRLDRIFACLGSNRDIVNVGNSLSETNPGSVEIDDSPLRLESVR